jgi:large repetitive protein
MLSGETISAGHRGKYIAVRLLLLLALLLGAASPSLACQLYGGVIDGNVNPVPPSQVQIDGHCRIQNFPQSNPLTTNFSFFTQPGQQDERWLIIFDNVVHTGQMSCNAVHGHKIWFTNGSSTTIQENCQNLLIPVEKIDKQNPAGPATATIGVPFTYTLTIPILHDPATGTTINFAGSPNTLHGLTVWDDLNATGADLTYVSHTAYWRTSGDPVAHTFSNVGGFLTFDDIPIVPAETQFVIELTVVLNDTPANTPGTQFVNTAKWDFGRLIDDVFYEPLPGEWGVTQPMTIAAPQLIVTKTGPATIGRTLNLGQWGEFGIDVRNAGLTDAWDVTIVDRLPDGPAGGMCDIAPEILSARVFAADGVTGVPGKGPLVPGTDFTMSWSGAAACELTLGMQTSAGAIGAGERLIVTYRTRLDPDSQDGITLTNVVGAVQWFNDAVANPDRVTYSRTLTNGTVGVDDHEDAHTVSVALYGYFFEKSVANLTSGDNPAATAAPGDTLRYTLRLQSTDVPLDDLRFLDDLGELNATAVFVPGTLALVAGTLPPGADASSTNSNGGTNGAGILDVRNLSLPAFSEVSIQFDITLAGTIANGTVVTNQAELIGAVKLADSDDPYVNGQADPDVDGDEDPTRVVIASAPLLDVDKISADIDGDPEVLLAGERLRYTITVRNLGTADANDAMLRDEVPANTTYVAGSTRLNGALVADGPGGVSPLGNGVPLSTPSDPTPGYLPADPAAGPTTVATVVFDVRVNPDVIDGTIISNQGFVSAPGGGVLDQPSDDPRTPAVDDPTRDLVGDLPFLFAEKVAALEYDAVSPGIVDPGDVLRYTIRIYNNGRVPATEVMLRDAVPANTTYVADSLTLNGVAVGQPDGGVSPLVAGIDVSSADLTPPLPGAGEGTLNPAESAVIQFDLRVNDGVPPGTLIVNQANVASAEVPDLLTDGDGNPATGPEPTVVVVGNVQQLRITKQVAVVGGGPALAGSTLEYVVGVTNIGAVPAYDVVIRDDLDVPVAGQLTFVDESWTMNGSANGITVADSLLTADYSTLYGPLDPGRAITVRFRAVLYPELPMGTRVTNTATVYWNDPVQQASASVSIDVGGTPGVGILSGQVWHDADFDETADESERRLEGWTVELYHNDELAHSTLTDADGRYSIAGVAPNYETDDTYEIRFARPGAGPATALLGRASSDFTNDLQRIADIEVLSGSNLQDLNLPIDPNGTVYNALSRLPIAGASLSLMTSAGAVVPASCFYDPNQQDQVTLADGYYKFDLSFADAACPSGGSYLIRVTPPSSAYIADVSEIIPPQSSAETAPFSVPACPASVDDAVPGTTGHCEAAPSELAPPMSVAARSAGTHYYLHLVLDDSFVPGTSQIFNNHIPLDLDLDASVTVTKTTPLVHVTRGQLVPYTITVTNGIGVNLPDVAVVDRLPAGFRYVEGSARLNGAPAEPQVLGRELLWNGLTVTSEGRQTLMLLLAVGSGVGEGEFVNRAQALHVLTGSPLSGEATATVRIVPDPALDCTDVIGKVFDDANRNGYQDRGEQGIPGVRLVTARGLLATTDRHGRYHITCAITPREGRGSNFVLKIDDRTLPTGYRASTQAVQVQRATRGKALELNFGASIHRVVGLDVADPVFEPGTIGMRGIWRPRIDLLIEELERAPAVLRLSYLADLEPPRLVEQRVEAMRKTILAAWNAQDDCCLYELVVEPEVFWRRGAPPDEPARRRRRSQR